jgi:tRNA pseudouridine55 synthase
VNSWTVTGVRPAGDFLDIDARVRCSSGTYVRALARDLGAALGTGGHLTALHRTAVGPYHIAQARTLEELAELAELQEQNPFPERSRHSPAAHAMAFPATPASEPRSTPAAPPVTPLAEAAAAAFPCLDLSADEASRLSHGARLPLPGGQPADGSPIAAFAPDGTLVALVAADKGQLRSLAVFAP